MLEYHAHSAALKQIRSSIQTTFAANLALKKQIDVLCLASDVEPDAAMVGSIIDVIIDHASSDGTELQLLEQASNLWAEGRILYDLVGDARAALESALLDPTDPSALQLASSALSNLVAMKATALALNADAIALHASIDPLPYLKAHPRQENVPSKKWGWKDVFLGRRTEAFVESLLRTAKTDRSKAFAFGALASYSSNVCGSAYLGCVVGGPRRLHRYRDRLARNAVGAWLHGQVATPACAALARRVGFRLASAGYGLPSDITASLTKSFKEAWPSREAPNFNLGLARTVRHLELLDTFERPDLPSPPPPNFGSSGGLSFLSDQDPNLPNIGIDTDGTVSGNVGGTNVANSKQNGGEICLAILAVLATIGIALLIYCIVQWAQKKACHPGDWFNSAQNSDEPDPRNLSNMNQQQLISLADPDAASHIVQELFSLQMMLWQGFDSAAAYLSVTGLIYPDELTISSPLYQQFLETPVRAFWPCLEENGAIDKYQFDPSTQVEAPGAPTTPFMPNESPLAFAGPWSPQFSQSATAIAHEVLTNILTGSREEANRDLDADRGYLHSCWDIQPKTSIHDPVLTVELLPYGAE